MTSEKTAVEWEREADQLVNESEDPIENDRFHRALWNKYALILAEHGRRGFDEAEAHAIEVAAEWGFDRQPDEDKTPKEQYFDDIEDVIERDEAVLRLIDVRISEQGADSTTQRLGLDPDEDIHWVPKRRPGSDELEMWQEACTRLKDRRDSNRRGLGQMEKKRAAAIYELDVARSVSLHYQSNGEVPLWQEISPKYKPYPNDDPDEEIGRTDSIWPPIGRFIVNQYYYHTSPEDDLSKGEIAEKIEHDIGEDDRISSYLDEKAKDRIESGRENKGYHPIGNFDGQEVRRALKRHENGELKNTDG